MVKFLISAGFVVAFGLGIAAPPLAYGEEERAEESRPLSDMESERGRKNIIKCPPRVS